MDGTNGDPVASEDGSSLCSVQSVPGSDSVSFASKRRRLDDSIESTNDKGDDSNPQEITQETVGPFARDFEDASSDIGVPFSPMLKRFLAGEAKKRPRNGGSQTSENTEAECANGDAKSSTISDAKDLVFLGSDDEAEEEPKEDVEKRKDVEINVNDH